MGMVDVAEQAPKVFGEAGSDVLADIETLRAIDQVQAQRGRDIIGALAGGEMDGYEKALARACLNEAHGRVVVARSPRDVLAALEVFEAAAADPEDVVMFVGKPGSSSQRTTTLQGQASRTISAGEQLHVSVSGNPDFSLSARQIHDGFFTAEAAKELSRRVTNPLLVGRSSVQGYLEERNGEIAKQQDPMERNGIVHEVADMHGQLMRRGFDVSDIFQLDPNFSEAVKRNREQLLVLGETLLGQAFKHAVWGKGSAREEKDKSERVLLDRTVYTAKALGLTGLEAVVVMTEPHLKLPSDEVSRRYATVREKVLAVMD